MSKHTPGPWEVVPVCGAREGFDICCEFERDGCHTVAEVPIRKFSKNEKANASLIAAAPDLLEALKGARKYVAFAFDQGIEGAEQAGIDLDSAIAKARGEA